MAAGQCPDPTLGRFVSADTIVPEPGNPQSLNRYAYVYNNPLKYNDPTGHFTEDQMKQHLQEQGYSDNEIASIIYMWAHDSEHQDWWALLMEAEPGDVLNAVNTRIGTGFDQLWNGMFLNNDEGKLLFRYINFQAHYNVATFYSDNPLDPETNPRQDIILGRKGTKLGLAIENYVFHAGTGIFAEGIFNSQPDQSKLGAGLVDVGGGATLMAHATGKVLIGAFTAPSGVGILPLAVGLGELCLGVATANQGFKEWISYFDEVNNGKYAQRRLELIGP